MSEKETSIMQSGVGTAPASSNVNIFSNEKSFELMMKIAESLSDSAIIPKEYQKNPGSCMIAVEMAMRLNINPMMVMQHLFVVNGRPAWSSQWIISMINKSRRYKTELQYEFGHEQADGGLSCRAWVEDWSGHKVYGPKVTMTMANAEGWVNKNGSKWKTMPEVMIQYRAASFFGRMNCPDMIMGIYSSDEAVEMGDSPVDGSDFVIDPNTGEVTEIEPHEKDEKITQEQRQSMFERAHDLFGKDDGNAILQELIKEEGYESSTSLLISAYNRILEKLNKIYEVRKSSQNAE